MRDVDPDLLTFQMEKLTCQEVGNRMQATAVAIGDGPPPVDEWDVAGPSIVHNRDYLCAVSERRGEEIVTRERETRSLRNRLMHLLTHFNRGGAASAHWVKPAWERHNKIWHDGGAQ